jgi:hypothetical protein
MFASDGFIMSVLMYWLSIITAAAAYPVVAGAVFVAIMAGAIMMIWNMGWLWGLGMITLFGLALGPALLLTPVILVVKGLAAVAPAKHTPATETSDAPRPMMPTPRDASRSR